MKGRDVMVDLQEWLGYDRVYNVNPVGRSGGLALFWKSSVNIDFLHVDKNLLDVQVQFGALNFFVSCVYGAPLVKNRAMVWEKISRLGVGRKEQWCMFGDFNDILNNEEKLGGPQIGDSVFKPFGDMIHCCDMAELPSNGNMFTRGGMRYETWVQSRLDHCFGNTEWFRYFPASNQNFFDTRRSDHKLVLVKLMESQQSYRGSFRFDKKFLFKEDVENEVKLAWRRKNNGDGNGVFDRLRRVRKSLSKWKRNNPLTRVTRLSK
ncbi:hypothetical protein N665_0027s0006 [Sinapis alba]|nr:hypothetical protein N665_0027s0006 [Sinapis alba]